MMKYSCSNPNQKSPSSSIVALPFEGCAVPSAFITSVITKYPLIRVGSGYIATGTNKQSEEPPSACLVEEPSNDQFPISAKVP